MNAINFDVSAQMEAHLDRFEADDALWVGIVCGKGKVFCGECSGSVHPSCFCDSSS